jgi:16S rRNA (uracil1498-N3)-methyltransferase
VPPRFYVDATLTAGTSLPLPADAAHHARRVLRLGGGDSIVLFNGRGGEYVAKLASPGGVATAAIERFDPVERESPLALTLLQALVAAEKLDWLVEKAVELGVARIVIAPTRRSVVRLDAERARKRLTHWRGIVRAACCQCGRNRLPEVDYCNTFEAQLAATPANARRLALLPGVGAPLRAASGATALLIGPEGGLTDEEVALALGAGFVSVRIGPRILRTETAGIAALAAMQTLGGDFGSGTA